jgi:hypothetical protein
MAIDPKHFSTNLIPKSAPCADRNPFSITSYHLFLRKKSDEMPVVKGRAVGVQVRPTKKYSIHAFRIIQFLGRKSSHTREAVPLRIPNEPVVAAPGVVHQVLRSDDKKIQKKVKEISKEGSWGFSHSELSDSWENDPIKRNGNSWVKTGRKAFAKNGNGIEALSDFGVAANLQIKAHPKSSEINRKITCNFMIRQENGSPNLKVELLKAICQIELDLENAQKRPQTERTDLWRFWANHFGVPSKSTSIQSVGCIFEYINGFFKETTFGLMPDPSTGEALKQSQQGMVLKNVKKILACIRRLIATNDLEVLLSPDKLTLNKNRIERVQKMVPQSPAETQLKKITDFGRPKLASRSRFISKLKESDLETIRGNRMGEARNSVSSPKNQNSQNNTFAANRTHRPLPLRGQRVTNSTGHRFFRISSDLFNPHLKEAVRINGLTHVG